MSTNLTLEPKPGTYALVFSSVAKTVVQIGKLGEIRLRPGWYVYVGSALAAKTGVLRRVTRHADPTRPKKWNVDYVKPHLRLLEIWYTHDPVRRECQWAVAVGAGRGAQVHLAQIGARDCKKCATHFYYFPRQPSLAAFQRRLTRAVAGHGPVGHVVAPSPEELAAQLAALVSAIPSVRTRKALAQRQ